MKIHKQLLLRICATLWSFLFIAIFFQNCGQPGEIALQSKLQEDPVDALDNNNNNPIPDPVTLISNPSLVINDGQPFTKSENVMLKSGTTGAEEMIISNQSDCSSVQGWIPFSQQTAWVLPAKNSDVAIYAKFRKKGAPESICVKASIVHDDIAPVISVVEPAPKFTTLQNVQVGFSANDVNGSGVSRIYCKPSNGIETSCVNMVNFTNLAELSYSVSIRAIDRAGNESLPSVDSFVVDRTPPVITVNGPSGIVSQPNPKYSMSIVEANGLKNLGCRLSPLETTYKDCSSLVVEYRDLPSGIYKFEVAAVDMAGNSSSAISSYENDISVPSVTITKAPLALGNIKNASFEFTGTSGAKAITKFMCSLNGAAPVSCASPISYTNLADKEHTFSVVGINAANVTSAAQIYKFVVDTTPPALIILSSPTGRVKDRNATIVLNATDANGIKQIQCSLNGVTSDCSSKTVTYTNLPDQNASYVFSAVAMDGAGNLSAAVSVTWIVDNSPESKILASMKQNPVALDAKGTLNISLTQVYKPIYSCVKKSDSTDVASGKLITNDSSIDFIVSEDIRCTISGLDKYDKAISVIVNADVECGNKIKENGKCVDFKCLSVVTLAYTKTLSIPARTSQGVCYAMKIFDAIENGNSNLTTTIDKEVISRRHGEGSGYTRNPYSMDSDLLNFVLSGPRVVKLSGGASATSPIKIDNFALIGLYPKAVSPLPSHFSAHGTADSTVDAEAMTIQYKNSPVVLKPFGPSGTATVEPLDIVRVADPNLNYMLDIRALDCGGSRELSTVYVLFQ